MAMGSKTQRNYRLPPDLVEQIQEYAKEHGISETEGATRLLALGLERNMAVKDDAEAEKIRMLGEHIRDLRDSVATLRGQLAAKDQQLTSAMQIASNQQLLEGVRIAEALGEEQQSVWARIVAAVRGHNA